MSSYLFPNTILGLAFPVVRTPLWHTGVQVALSGKQSTIAYQQYPLIHYELNYDVLRDDIATSDAKAIVGLFNAVQGRFDTFLFTDPDFNTIASSAPQTFGTGDGTTTTFQLTASYANSGGPGYSELIQNFNGTPTILDNGSAAGSNTIGATGIVTFSTAPASGHVLSWYGSFYYRCRFDDDKLDLEKMMNLWWALKSLGFTSVKL